MFLKAPVSNKYVGQLFSTVAESLFFGMCDFYLINRVVKYMSLRLCGSGPVRIFLNPQHFLSRRIQKFPHPHVIGFVADWLFCILESAAFKNIRIRRMRMRIFGCAGCGPKPYPERNSCRFKNTRIAVDGASGYACFACTSNLKASWTFFTFSRRFAKGRIS